MKTVTFGTKQKTIQHFLQDYDTNEVLKEELHRVAAQHINDMPPVTQIGAELHKVVEYLAKSKFNLKHWSLAGITCKKRNYYNFLNQKTGEQFDLRVNHTGSVTPIHQSINKKINVASTIQEAIQKYDY